MIRDIILYCLNLDTKSLVIEQFLTSDAISKLMHPCESKILQDIIEIINLLSDITSYTRLYGGRQNVSAKILRTDADLSLSLPESAYTKAFYCGIDKALKGYYREIADLEQDYLRNPKQSLLFIYQRLIYYKPLALHFRKLICTIHMQRLQGSALFQYLHQNKHGDHHICKAMKTVQSAVSVIFLKQLSNWLLYSKLDSLGEFFIQYMDDNDSTIDTGRSNSARSGRQTYRTTSNASDIGNNSADIWHFQIEYNLLPYHFSSSWAEKVLFVGQAVVLFKNELYAAQKSAHIWNKSEQNIFNEHHSLWNENEHIFFIKIQALQYEEFNTSNYEHVIDEIKSYVTRRLSDIAFNDADLLQHLKLIKDFYLLGRGELFLEFLNNTKKIAKDVGLGFMLSEYVRAFELAAHGFRLTEDVDQFSLCIRKSYLDANQLNDIDHLQYLQLQHKINWPLQLLFSPQVIERYNMLFHFLLLIKKVQSDFHNLWFTHIREARISGYRNLKLMNFRNQLMFFIDNLQYYIQVDVIESQFSILWNKVLDKIDFEQIQKAHSVFQANILSLCFLLNHDEAMKISATQTTTMTCSNNPVYLIINDIFHICEDFSCALNTGCSIEDEELDPKINLLKARFRTSIEQLLNLMVGLKTTSNTTPLSQLLLRLDFNRWFSANYDPPK